MYTLQILDAGQTFLHTLGEQPIVAGSSDAAGIRLREAGVAAEHAEFVPNGQGVRLVARADLRVNGAAVREAELQLGDRIELGRAVLVVGRTVARPAEPDDVLAGAIPRGGSRRPRRSSSKVVPIVAGLLLAGGIIAFAMQGGDDGHVVSARLADVASARNDGDLDRARLEVATLRREWAAATDDRLDRLDAAEARIDAIERRRDELLAEVRDPQGRRDYRDWFRELQDLERSRDPGERVAARYVRSRLRATLLERDEELAARGASERPVEDRDVVEAQGDANEGVTPRPAPAVALDDDDVRRLVEQGLFAQALALIQAEFELAADDAAIAALRERDLRVREQARAASERLLADVRAQASAGDDGVARAVAMLEAARHRFPTSGAFHALTSELTRLSGSERERAGAGGSQPSVAVADGQPQPARRTDEATRLQTLAQLRSQMDAIRAAEEGCEFARAAQLLREAGVAVEARDAEFSERLQRRAAEADLLAKWHDHVAEHVAGGRSLAVEDAGGRDLTLVRVDGARLIARSADGEAPFAWYELAGEGIRALFDATRARGAAALGAAALLYKQGETEIAETILAGLVKQDAALLAQANDVIARGRGEPVGDYGYVLRKGTFVSERAIEVEKVAVTLAPKLAAALRDRREEARDAFVQQTAARGGVELEALGSLLQQSLDELREKVDGSKLRKQVDKMTALRVELDAARDHARELIFDEVKYFYPYKPPAVSGERHAEYNRVQQEIDRRVAALRDIWENTRLKLRVPDKFVEQVEQLDWHAKWLAQLGQLPAGESVATLLASIEWARALPSGGAVGLQEFCLTSSEKDRRAEWDRVVAYNERLGGELSNAQQALLRITNDYRLMFGHRPLAAALTCMDAAQGHADEMSKLGYFSHMSPTEGRRTPYDRMKLAGYMFGVSENIAMTGGAEAAHTAWCHSSGHHRNLLNAGHTEVGLGANGRYWVENFGSGFVHRQHPAWAKVD